MSNTEKTVDHNILSAAKALGGDAAKGVDSIVALAKLVFDHTVKGELNTDTSKKVYDAYINAQNENSKTAVTVNKDSLKNSYSRLNLFVKLAQAGIAGAWAKMDLAVVVRQEMKKANTQALVSTYVALVETARDLNKRVRLAADEGKPLANFDFCNSEYIEALLKGDKKDDSFDAVIEEAAKALERKALDEKKYNAAERVAFNDAAAGLRRYKTPKPLAGTAPTEAELLKKAA